MLKLLASLTSLPASYTHHTSEEGFIFDALSWDPSKFIKSALIGFGAFLRSQP
jgi:hypothetical protein